jgi:hypothetical protein
MPELHQQSSADLIRLAAEQMSSLVRSEIALAQAEVTTKARTAGRAAGMFGGAGVTALYGVGALTAAAVLGLDRVLPAWLAALLVGVALLLVTGVLALTGRARLRRVGSLVPQRALRGLQADVATLSHPAPHRANGATPGGTVTDGVQVSTFQPTL